MNRPIRIQRKRTKGFSLQAQSPDGRPVVSVCRPGKWGNPFRVGAAGPLGRTAIDNEGAVGFFRQMMADPELRTAAGYPSDLAELRDKHLACFCGLNEACHASVLLELANA